MIDFIITLGIGVLLCSMVAAWINSARHRHMRIALEERGDPELYHPDNFYGPEPHLPRKTNCD